MQDGVDPHIHNPLKTAPSVEAIFYVNQLIYTLTLRDVQDINPPPQHKKKEKDVQDYKSCF